MSSRSRYLVLQPTSQLGKPISLPSKSQLDKLIHGVQTEMQSKLDEIQKQEKAAIEEAERVRTKSLADAKCVLEKANADAKAKMDALSEREKVVAGREAKWSTIQHSIEKFKTRVKLNVGGAKFETTRTTLSQAGDETMLALMFSGRHEIELDEDGYTFLDRDGTHFNTILNFLRTGDASWPNDNMHRQQLITELEFYMLLEPFKAATGNMSRVVPAVRYDHGW